MVNGQAPRSLGTAAARNLATTTKSVPQMRGTSPRWLLRMLPWVEAPGGVYRVNHRLTYVVGDGRVSFTTVGTQVRVVPADLRELPLLRGYADDAVLTALADRLVQRELEPGESLVDSDQLLLIAHGKLARVRAGRYGEEAVLGTLADGDHVGDEALLEPGAGWGFTLRAVTACTVLALPRQDFQDLVDQSETLRAQVDRFRARGGLPRNKQGEAAIVLAAGHTGEPPLPGTFIDYELAPREYELSVAQTVLRLHTRVTDLYNRPMDQLEQQVRLTIEALRERQEHELINNTEFGLLHNADLSQRIQTRTGPPTPADLDEILARRRKSRFLLAHPRTIAAFGRECTSRGLYPATVDVGGHPMIAWRGVPMLPCNKIPVSPDGVSSILALRTGEDDEGVIGLHQTGIPDEYEPGLNVRLIGINDKAVRSYVISAYYSVAVLVPDALGVLENVEINRPGEGRP